MNPTTTASDIAAQGRKDLEHSARWQTARQEFYATGQAQVVQGLLRETIDAAVLNAYEASLAGVLPPGSALFAVDDFARGACFPYSDTDIVILREGDSSEDIRQGLTEFVRLLWGQGVRPALRVSSLAEAFAIGDQNVDLASKLIARRTLAGDPDLSKKLDCELKEHRQRLTHRIISLTRTRHAQQKNTPSHKEPNVTETPGGLRDLRAIAKLDQLNPGKLVGPETLKDSTAFLAFVRVFLHYRARDDRNLFDFEAQNDIVERFASGATRSSWMREYFEHARRVFNSVRRALDACEGASGAPIETFHDRQSRLSNSDFSVLNGRLYLRRAADLADKPEIVFRVLELVARHGVPPGCEIEKRLELAKNALADFCKESRMLWPEVKTILSLPHASQAIRLLSNTCLLSSVFPEWHPIEGYTSNGGDHAYTADEHAFRMIEQLGELRQAADETRQRFFQLLCEAEGQEILLFSLLFHQASTALVREVSSRISMPTDHGLLAAFLIENETVLQQAILRDIEDPANIRLLAEQVGTIERLRLLVIAAYANLSATHTNHILEWRLERLWRMYLATRRELTRELENDRILQIPATLPEGSEFIKGFPGRYLRARTSADIDLHTRLYKLSQETGVAVELENVEGAYKLTVIAHDRTGLFSSFAGAISSFGLNIVKAEAFSNEQGVILDTFTFTDPKRALSFNPSETERLQDLTMRLALGKTEVKRLFRISATSSAKRPSVEPQVQFDSDACETATLVQISAEDRPGILYNLASVFSFNGCSIDTVLIDTKGHRAIDIFYVTRDGKKLPPDSHPAITAQLISACRAETAE